MIKKIIIMIALCFAFWGNTANSQTVTLGYVDFPPYEFEDKNGKPDGILVEIVETIFKRAKIPLKLKFLPFKRAYKSSKIGEIDGLFNFYKTEKRLKFFDYTEPVISNPLVFFTRKDSMYKYNKLEDLKGLKVGVIRGYTYGENFDENILFTRDEVSSHFSNFKKLVHRRIDVYPCDELVGIHVAMKNKFMSELKILPTPLKVMDGYIGFTKGKHKKIINKINQIIIEMRQNGEIDTMIDLYVENSL